MAACREVSTGKSQRKQNKKVSKIKEQLARKENVTACDHPTSILCVQNGGLDNGVSQDELMTLFAPYGAVQDIIMVPRKPFCFVCFNSANSAAVAQQQLMGHLLREGKDPSQNITLYPFFVDSAPSNVCPSKELPPGLILLEDFISVETEQLLLDTILFDSQPTQDTGSTGSTLKHRDVKHYGYEFKYGINNVDPNKPLAEGIPRQCQELLQRAVDMNIVGHFPDQLTVNRYLPGQGIPPHVDTPSAFEDGIMSLSCGSQVIMDFRHPDGRHLSVLVPPRSLLVMTGESRYVWSHGITPRKSDILPSPAGGITLATRGVRTSFTFRKLSPTAGIIEPNETNSSRCLPQTDKEAADLEKQHVHQVYEEIADHFSDTRHKPWPRIAQFLQDQEPGSILLDVGCGNGKYFGVNNHLCQIGCERSSNLSSIVQCRGYEVMVGDVLAIPVRSCSVDVSLCIAVIHHLATKERRKQAIEELVRILRPGGCVLIYVWAQEQQKDNQKSTYLKPHRQYKKEARSQKTSIHAADLSECSTETLCEKFPGKLNISCPPENERAAKETDSQSVSETTNQVHVPRHSNELKIPNRNCDNMSDTVVEKYGHISSERGDVESKNFDTPETPNTNVEHLSETVVAKQAHISSETGVVDTKSFETSETQDNSNSDLRTKEHESDNALKTSPNSQPLQVHVNRTEFKDQDMLVPWQLKKSRSTESCGADGKEKQTFHRFYHVFQQGELDALCGEVSDCFIQHSYYDQGNWCVVLQKQLN